MLQRPPAAPDWEMARSCTQSCDKVEHPRSGRPRNDLLAAASKGKTTEEEEKKEEKKCADIKVLLLVISGGQAIG